MAAFAAAVGVTATLGVALLLIWAHGSGVGSAAADEPWPPFVMVYRDTARGYGPNGSMGTQVFRLDYRDSRHFRSVLLEHSAVPEAVGLTQTFDGRQSTFADPRFGVRVTPYAPHERTVPADWLVPAQVPPLAQRPGATTVRLASGLALVTHEAIYGARRVRTEITYRELDGIPIQMVESTDGDETRRVEVVELRLGSR